MKKDTKLLMEPFTAVSCRIIPATMTMDRKCGRYEAVCTNFLNRLLFTSFSSNAKMIGTGKVKSSAKPPSISVFPNTFQKVGS
ncbi:hypothetical protein D1872_279660 [compost metagenome]